MELRQLSGTHVLYAFAGRLASLHELAPFLFVQRIQNVLTLPLDVLDPFVEVFDLLDGLSNLGANQAVALQLPSGHLFDQGMGRVNFLFHRIDRFSMRLECVLHLFGIAGMQRLGQLEHFHDGLQVLLGVFECFLDRREFVDVPLGGAGLVALKHVPKSEHLGHLLQLLLDDPPPLHLTREPRPANANDASEQPEDAALHEDFRVAEGVIYVERFFADVVLKYRLAPGLRVFFGPACVPELENTEFRAKRLVLHAVGKPCLTNFERRDDSSSNELLEHHLPVHQPADLSMVRLDASDEQHIALLQVRPQSLELRHKLRADSRLSSRLLLVEQVADALIGRGQQYLIQVGQQRIAGLRDEVLDRVQDGASIVLDSEAFAIVNLGGVLSSGLNALGLEDLLHVAEILHLVVRVVAEIAVQDIDKCGAILPSLALVIQELHDAWRFRGCEEGHALRVVGPS
mmetsp:Transcript_52183/g.145639  ORF Transcript_52183/g.145639 Transcript_52183/m.145639 type:complete len:458 (+) Transcript_52183:1245-2618(+)